MSEENPESKSMLRNYWDGYKEFWTERFSFLEKYSKIIHPEKPLPKWDISTVDEFVASDPVHGHTLKTARDAAQFGLAGAVVGAVSSGALAWKWSRSPHGAALSFAFGAAVGSTFGIEIANHYYQLYRLDPLTAQVKFFEWLQNRG